MYTKKQKKSSEGVFSKFLVNLYACCLFPASFQYTSSTFLNPTQLVAIVSLPLFYLLSLKSIYAFHFPHQNVELCFCFSLLVIVKVAATFTLVFEARGSRLSETFRGPKAKKQPLWDLEATLQPRELVPEDGLRAEVMDSRLRKGGKVAVERKGGANRKA